MNGGYENRLFYRLAVLAVLAAVLAGVNVLLMADYTVFANTQLRFLTFQ